MVVSVTVVSLMDYWSGCCIGSGTGPVSPSVWKVSSSASKDTLTGANHVITEGELLAVKDESISVFPETSIAISAVLLQSFDSIPLVINLVIVFFDSIIVSVDCVMVIVDVLIIVADAVFKAIDFVV